MASTRRLARTATTVLACSAFMVVPSAAALAAPPDHAPAHGQADRDRTPARSTSVATAKDQGGAGQGGASQGGASQGGRGQGGGGQDASERGRGRADAPGQQKKQGTVERRPAGGPSAGTGQPGADAPGRAPEPRAGRAGEPAPAPIPEPAPVLVVQPADVTAPQPPPPAAVPDPAPVAATASSGTADAQPAPVEVAPPPAPAPEPEPVGRRVVRPHLGGPFSDLLRDVGTSIRRVVPQDLGPIREPLAEMVPLLLAVLGAFLALQRGLGRGLGQVPMVAVAPRHDVVRHGR